MRAYPAKTLWLRVNAIGLALAGACLILVGPVVAQPAPDGEKGARLGRFLDFLSIPNETRNAAQLEETARHIETRLEEAGLRVRRLAADGEDAPPLLYAHWEGEDPSATLAVYAHYDAVPAAPDAWRTAPFEPVIFSNTHERGGVELGRDLQAVSDEARIYARAAADAKAPIFALIETISDWRREGRKPAVSIRIFLDGEEEVGSPNLIRVREENKAAFADVDGWFFVDGPMHVSGRPTLVHGARGIANFAITFYGANRPLHSGHYGNWAPQATTKLVNFLAALRSQDGSVNLDGFDRYSVNIGPEKKKALDVLAAYDDALRKDLGIAQTEGAPASLFERLLSPSLSITALEAGLESGKPRNIIPDRARAYLEARLTPGLGAGAICAMLEEKLDRAGYVVHRVSSPEETPTSVGPGDAALSCTDHNYDAVRAPLDHPFSLAVAEALSTIADEEVIRIPMAGGSLPLAKLVGDSDGPVLVLPVVNHDNNQHAPNENLRVGALWYAFDVMEMIFGMTATQDAAP